jgi:hypothetical protein
MANKFRYPGFRLNYFPYFIFDFTIFKSFPLIKPRLIVVLTAAIVLCFPLAGFSQFDRKIVFNPQDSTNDYYLAVPPISGHIQGVLLLISSFSSPEYVLTETKLPNTASGNDLLTIVASMGTGLWADSASVGRLNQILAHVIGQFSVDTAKFALGGLGYAGDIALRYTELCYEKPNQFPVLPKLVFAINCPVDLLGLAHWCEEEIKKNYYPGDVGDGKYILDALTKKFGNYLDHTEKYIEASPFYKVGRKPGNEQFLYHVAVRLYYDLDIAWQLRNRRNSYYDTFIPDGSEMIKQLLLAGNSEAEFIASQQPGIRSSGQKSPFSWSLVDENDCIQWIQQGLKIFNPQNYSPVYQLPIPSGWSTESFSLPPDFARQMKVLGVEDLRFFPGWGDPLSEEHWSYAYLWWLEGIPEIGASWLEDNLRILYTGLINRNIQRRKIPLEKIFPVSVQMKIVKTISGDWQTFEGTVHMLNYINQTPMILNVIVHKKNCTDKNHAFLFFEVSPKPFEHPNWEKLNKLNTDFSCVK